MRHLLAAVWIAAIISGVAGAAADSVEGTWSAAVDSPHGAVTMTLTLHQDGQTVAGTLASDHTGSREIRGQFAEGRLKLNTVSGSPDISLEGTMQDGKLSGYLSTEMGDMRWTAERIRER